MKKALSISKVDDLALKKEWEMVTEKRGPCENALVRKEGGIEKRYARPVKSNMALSRSILVSTNSFLTLANSISCYGNT